MRFTLRQLQVFLATAKRENLSHAAQQLAMSQSAASGAIKELERQFDVQLFDRREKRLQLSELGHRLRPAAEDLLARADELQALLEGDQVSGRLKVGASLTIGNYLAVPILADYRQAYPAVDASLEVANTRDIAEAVADFQLDVGLIEGEWWHPDLEVTSWREDELQVFCEPEHPLARKRSVGDRELIEAQWIVREPGSGTRQVFDRAMHDILPQLQISLELQHTEAIKRAVEAGMGLGCLSRISLEDAFKRGSLVPLRVRGRDFTRQMSIVTHRRKYHGRAFQQWLALCQEYRS